MKTNEGRRSSSRCTVAGLLFSVAFAGCMLWFAGNWLSVAGWPKDGKKEPVGENEAEIFRLMGQIAKAQKEYWDRSAGILGQNQFAQFLAHLWITPDHQGRPVEMNLVPKRMALAMGRNHTLHGYFFVDVHERYGGPSEKTVKLDYSRQWAVAAVPAETPKTGFIVFLADESGKVFVKFVKNVPQKYPEEPLRSGWRAVESQEERLLNRHSELGFDFGRFSSNSFVRRLDSGSSQAPPGMTVLVGRRYNQNRHGLGFYFGKALTASFQRFALECIPGRFASAFHRGMAETSPPAAL